LSYDHHFGARAKLAQLVIPPSRFSPALEPASGAARRYKEIDALDTNNCIQIVINYAPALNFA